MLFYAEGLFKYSIHEMIAGGERVSTQQSAVLTHTTTTTILSHIIYKNMETVKRFSFRDLLSTIEDRDVFMPKSKKITKEDMRKAQASRRRARQEAKRRAGGQKQRIVVQKVLEAKNDPIAKTFKRNDAGFLWAPMRSKLSSDNLRQLKRRSKPNRSNGDSDESSTTAKHDNADDEGSGEFSLVYDNWVQCTKCEKWRQIPQDLVIQNIDVWVCSEHPDPQWASCDVPEVKWNMVDYEGEQLCTVGEVSEDGEREASEKEERKDAACAKGEEEASKVKRKKKTEGVKKKPRREREEEKEEEEEESEKPTKKKKRKQDGVMKKPKKVTVGGEEAHGAEEEKVDTGDNEQEESGDSAERERKETERERAVTYKLELATREYRSNHPTLSDEPPSPATLKAKVEAAVKKQKPARAMFAPRKKVFNLSVLGLPASTKSKEIALATKERPQLIWKSDEKKFQNLSEASVSEEESERESERKSEKESDEEEEEEEEDAEESVAQQGEKEDDDEEDVGAKQVDEMSERELFEERVERLDGGEGSDEEEAPRAHEQQATTAHADASQGDEDSHILLSCSSSSSDNMIVSVDEDEEFTDDQSRSAAGSGSGSDDEDDNESDVSRTTEEVAFQLRRILDSSLNEASEAMSGDATPTYATPPENDAEYFNSLQEGAQCTVHAGQKRLRPDDDDDDDDDEEEEAAAGEESGDEEKEDDSESLETKMCRQRLHRIVKGELEKVKRLLPAEQVEKGADALFACPAPGCTARFKSHGGWRYHYVGTHVNAWSAVCPWQECGLQFSNYNMYRLHTERCNKYGKFQEDAIKKYRVRKPDKADRKPDRKRGRPPGRSLKRQRTQAFPDAVEKRKKEKKELTDEQVARRFALGLRGVRD